MAGFDTALEDAAIIEKSGFTPDIKFVAASAIFSLRFLTELAKKKKIKIEGLEPTDIIHSFRKLNAPARKLRGDEPRLGTKAGKKKVNPSEPTSR